MMHGLGGMVARVKTSTDELLKPDRCYQNLLVGSFNPVGIIMQAKQKHPMIQGFSRVPR